MTFGITLTKSLEYQKNLFFGYFNNKEKGYATIIKNTKTYKKSL